MGSDRWLTTLAVKFPQTAITAFCMHVRAYANQDFKLRRTTRHSLFLPLLSLPFPLLSPLLSSFHFFLPLLFPLIPHHASHIFPSLPSLIRKTPKIQLGSWGAPKLPGWNWIWWIFYLKLWPLLTLMPFWKESWQYFFTNNMTNTLRHGWSHITQTTSDPVQQLRLGMVVRSSLSPPSTPPLPFPIFLSPPLVIYLPFLLNPGTWFRKTL